MNNIIQLMNTTSIKGGLALHPKLAMSLGIKQKTYKLVRFGSLRFRVFIDLTEDLPFNKASLSTEIVDKLNIPVHCSLEMTYRNGEFIIGPLIGLLAGWKVNELEERLIHLRDYLFHYKEINGCVLAFTLDSVDRKNLSIEGYLYNPNTKQWEKGIYPYPSSMLVLEPTVSPAWVQHFEAIIGKTLCNAFLFNQWEAHKRLVSSIHTKNYLPETILYTNPSDLYYFLNKYFIVTVKPINHSMVHPHPIKVTLKDRQTIVISNPNKNEVNTYKCYNRDQAYSVFNRYFKEQEFIIQEAVEVPGYQTITCQVLLTKSEHTDWKETGVLTRDNLLGLSPAPVVPLSKSKLKSLLNKGDLYISMTYQELIHIAKDAVNVLEKDGQLANAAVELIIGELGDIWIQQIEVCYETNEMFLLAGYPEHYFDILKMNMLYAKKLAGF